jgi:hypothetical protein
VRTVAWLGGIAVVAVLVVMAVAGFPGAVPILISAGALVAMIGLGGVMGGRHTPNVPPVPPGGAVAGTESAGGGAADAEPVPDRPDGAPGGNASR